MNAGNETLSTWLFRSKATDSTVVVGAAIELCDVVLHSRRTVKFLSPRLILVDSGGRVTDIIDDGLVQAEDFGYVAPELLGTGAEHQDLRYSAQAGHYGELVSRAFIPRTPSSIDWECTCVFSIGCIMWHMRAGRPLFIGTSDYETISQVRTFPASPPSASPEPVDSIIAKAVEKMAEHRHSRLSELRDVLTRDASTTED